MLFRASGAGDALRADVFLRPYGRVAGSHIHLRQEEHVAVIAGRIGYRSGRSEGVLGPRQAVTFERGVAHTIWNAGDSEAHATIELRPAAGAEGAFEWLFRLAREGRTDEHGLPGPLELAVLAQRYGYFSAGTPLFVQRPLASILAPIARAFGVGRGSTRPGDGAGPGRADRGRRRG